MVAQTEDRVVAPGEGTAYLDEMNMRCMDRLGFDAIVTFCENGDCGMGCDSWFDVMGLMIAYGMVSGNPERWMGRAGGALRRELEAISERNGGMVAASLAFADGEPVFWSTGKALAALGWIGQCLAFLDGRDVPEDRHEEQ